MNHPAEIMIVEDEPKIAALLHDYLVADGFRTRVHADGANVVADVRALPPDLMLLDVMLPSVDGLTICRQVRTFSNVQIIMLTARVEEIDRLLGLESGADDYVCKPFSPREVVARVKAILRRVERNERTAVDNKVDSNIPIIPITLNEEKFAATLNGVAFELTPVEFRLLATLAAQPGRVFSRNQLMDILYLDHRVVSDRTVDSHVKNLRRKLVEAGGDDEWLRSIYGVGHKIEW